MKTNPLAEFIAERRNPDVPQGYRVDTLIQAANFVPGGALVWVDGEWRNLWKLSDLDLTDDTVMVVPIATPQENARQKPFHFVQPPMTPDFGDHEPGGVMACSPELLDKMQKNAGPSAEEMIRKIPSIRRLETIFGNAVENYVERGKSGCWKNETAVGLTAVVEAIAAAMRKEKV